MTTPFAKTMHSVTESTIANVLASFYAASRIARPLRNELMIVNGATAAGMLIHFAGGARAALAMLERAPDDETWDVARMYIERAVEAEAAGESGELPRAAGDGR